MTLEPVNLFGVVALGRRAHDLVEDALVPPFLCRGGGLDFILGDGGGRHAGIGRSRGESWSLPACTAMSAHRVLTGFGATRVPSWMWYHEYNVMQQHDVMHHVVA